VRAYGQCQAPRPPVSVCVIVTRHTKDDWVSTVSLIRVAKTKKSIQSVFFPQNKRIKHGTDKRCFLRAYTHDSALDLNPGQLLNGHVHWMFVGWVRYCLLMCYGCVLWAPDTTAFSQTAEFSGPALPSRGANRVNASLPNFLILHFAAGLESESFVVTWPSASYEAFSLGFTDLAWTERGRIGKSFVGSLAKGGVVLRRARAQTGDAQRISLRIQRARIAWL